MNVLQIFVIISAMHFGFYRFPEGLATSASSSPFEVGVDSLGLDKDILIHDCWGWGSRVQQLQFCG